MKKANLNEAKQKLHWQLKAGVITESQYGKKLALLEDDTVLGSTNPIPLKQIAAKKAGADAVIGGGAEDGNPNDDKVAGQKASIAVSALKPAQTEIIKEKAFGMAIGMLQKGKWDGLDLGSIISKDNYIMDGHHRWAAVSLIDPKAKLQGTVIDLPGGPLVSALNLATVGKLGITAGNKGKGNVAEFTGDKIAVVIDAAIKDGIKGEFPLTPDQVKEALGKVPGANGDANKGKQVMMQNADALPKTIMPGAPPRVDMPVIDGSKVATVQKMLASGMMDIKPPYSKDVKANLDVKESVDRKLNNLLQEVLKKGKI
jgi:hypothetical protein